MLSRREVKELITKGRVTIDGTVEKHPERKVTGEEQIVVAGELLRVQRTLTLMLHKPQGVVSAARDARDKTVLELVPPEYRRKELFPAGRLVGRRTELPECARHRCGKSGGSGTAAGNQGGCLHA